MKRRILLVLVFVVLCAAIGGYGYFQYVVKPAMIQGFIAKAPHPPTTVSAETAKTEHWVTRRTAVGTFRATQGVDIASEVAGTVSSIDFQSGQTVKAGELLVQLDNSTEQADLASNLAQLHKDQLDLRRQQELLNRGNTAKSSYDAAVMARETASAAVARSRATIAKKQIRAPFDGRVGIRTVDLGQYLSPGATIVTLQKIDPIFVDFTLPEQAVADVRVGQKIEVRVDAYPGTVYHGKVQSIDARINQDTRTIAVRGEMTNPEGKLLPGMFANVEVLVGEPRDVVTLPRTAVTYSLYGDTVYVVTREKPQAAGGGGNTPAQPNAGGSDLVIERRFVHVGDTRGDRVAIVDGVTAGEEVVSSGQIKLENGMHVRIDNAGAPIPPATLPTE